MDNQALANITVILVEPQDDINIGNTVRACKNFGVRNIRLVEATRGRGALSVGFTPAPTGG